MDYYKVLDVDENATQEQIKKAFRKMSLKHHPDRGGDAEQFKKINAAYQILGDNEKRREYMLRGKSPFANMNNMNGMNGMNAMDIDPILKMFFGGMHGMPGMSGMPGMPGMPGMSGMPGMPGMSGMPNVHIFRNGRPINVNTIQKPTPIIKTVIITLSQSFFGLTYPLLIERWILVNNEKRIEKEKIYINIKQGVDSGEIIIVKDKGNIINNQLRGDIKIHIKVENKSMFKRDGLNLKINKSISLKESLTGFTFDIKHINGKKYTINNDSGNIIPVNYIKQIEGLGITRDGKSGKLIIEFLIEFPEKLTPEQIEKIKEIL